MSDTNTASNFLNNICDAALLFKAKVKPFDVKISIDLPKESYTRFENEINQDERNINLADFDYGFFKISVTCMQDS